MGFFKRLIDSFKLWKLKRQRERDWPLKDMVRRLRVVLIDDSQWLAHDKKAIALIDRYICLSDPHNWEKTRVDHASQFRVAIGSDPHDKAHAVPEDPMRHITNNDDLVCWQWYWCRNKRTGVITLEQCRVDSGFKYIGDHCIWAMDDNNQAMKRWDIIGIATPPDFDKYVPNANIKCMPKVVDK